MRRRPTSSTITDTLVPYTTRFRARDETNASKATAKSGSLESSRIRQAAGRLAEGVDHRRDFGRAGLEGGAVDDEARGHLCDHLDFHRSEEHTSDLQSLMRT